MASKRSKAVKNAFAERLKADWEGPVTLMAPGEWAEEKQAPYQVPEVLLNSDAAFIPVRAPRKGEWTKDTAVIPQNMRNDPLSIFVNTMNLWGLMATGWCAIARASWGLD
jgi:hypothetical protein